MRKREKTSNTLEVIKFSSVIVSFTKGLPICKKHHQLKLKFRQLSP